MTHKAMRIHLSITFSVTIVILIMVTELVAAQPTLIPVTATIPEGQELSAAAANANNVYLFFRDKPKPIDITALNTRLDALEKRLTDLEMRVSEKIDNRVKVAEANLNANVLGGLDRIPETILKKDAAKAIKDGVIAEVKSEILTIKEDILKELRKPGR
jgi:hypothetical protein